MYSTFLTQMSRIIFIRAVRVLIKIQHPICVLGGYTVLHVRVWVGAATAWYRSYHFPRGWILMNFVNAIIINMRISFHHLHHAGLAAVNDVCLYVALKKKKLDPYTIPKVIPTGQVRW